MSATLRLSIAGLGAVVQALEADLDLEPHGAAARFAVDDVAADLTVRARWTTALDRVRTAPVFDSGALWQLHRSTGGWLFQFESPSLGPAPYKMAWVNSTFTDT